MMLHRDVDMFVKVVFQHKSEMVLAFTDVSLTTGVHACICISLSKGNTGAESERTPHDSCWMQRARCSFIGLCTVLCRLCASQVHHHATQVCLLSDKVHVHSARDRCPGMATSENDSNMTSGAT